MTLAVGDRRFVPGIGVGRVLSVSWGVACVCLEAELRGPEGAVEWEAREFLFRASDGAFLRTGCSHRVFRVADRPARRY